MDANDLTTIMLTGGLAVSGFGFLTKNFNITAAGLALGILAAFNSHNAHRAESGIEELFENRLDLLDSRSSRGYGAPLPPN